MEARKVTAEAFPCNFILPIDFKTRKLYKLLCFLIGLNLGFCLDFGVFAMLLG